MRSLLVIFILLVCAFPGYSESVILISAKDVTEDSVKGAVPAILKRCEAYGYSGMTAGFLIHEKQMAISLTSPDEIGDEMRESLNRLFSVAGRSVDLLQVYTPTDAEREQFKPGGAAPNGAMWMYALQPSGWVESAKDGIPPILVYSGRSVPRTEMFVDMKSRSLGMKLAALKTRKMDGIVDLCVDGNLLHSAYTSRRVYTSSVQKTTKECGKCNGNGYTIFRSEYRGSVYNPPINTKRVCAECSGTGSISSNEILWVTFDDRVAFAWIAFPLSFSCSVIRQPTGFLPLPKPPAAVQAPTNQSAKCSACSGSGICAYCGGTGLYKGATRCSICCGGGGALAMTGKCARCRGTGQIK